MDRSLNVIDNLPLVLDENDAVLTEKEQKLMLNLISKFKPDDAKNEEYELSIKEYCEIYGIENDIEVIEDSLQSLANKSFWLQEEDSEVLCRWLAGVTVYEDGGIITFKLDEDLRPFYSQLQTYLLPK